VPGALSHGTPGWIASPCAGRTLSGAWRRSPPRARGTGTGTAALTGNVILLTADSTIAVGGADTLALSGNIFGGAGISKAGTGTLTLSGANVYSGATTINAGTLVAASANALGSTVGGTTVASGATLNVDNVALAAEPITVRGGPAEAGPPDSGRKTCSCCCRTSAPRLSRPFRSWPYRWRR